MKYYLHLIALLLCCTLLSLPCGAQLHNTFNINIDNGLPDNHVYSTAIDRYGYLWICTPKGVVKYNGYTSRLFNLSDGLPNEDIWQLFEDGKGRMWLNNISTDLGYILNDKYHKAAIANSNSIVYPKNISASGKDIVFFSHYINGKKQLNICDEHNDTIVHSSVNAILHLNEHDSSLMNYVFFTKEGDAVIIYKNDFYKIPRNTQTAEKIKGSFFPIGKSSPPLFVFSNHSYSVYDIKPEGFSVIDLQNWQITNVNMADWGIKEPINYIYPEDDSTFAIVTDNIILTIEHKNGLNKKSLCRINQLIDDSTINGKKIFSVISNSFWNNCIGTFTNGVFINYAATNNFHKESIYLTNYKYLGKANDSVTFWWNEITGTISRIAGTQQTVFYKNTDLKSLHFITPYNQDTFLLSGNFSYYYVPHSNKLITLNYAYGTHIYAAVMADANNHFIVNMDNFYHVLMKGKSIEATYFDRERYDHLEYDSLRKNYWAYNREKIYIHGSSKDTIITKNNIGSFGINKIEKIAFDNKFGNIFIKGVDNIVMYSPENKTCISLFGHINLRDAHLLIYGTTLLVYGQFGVLFSTITGRQQLSEPLMYANIKNTNYKYLHDCVPSGNKLLLSTDKGTYSVVIPGRNMIMTGPARTVAYKFVVNYADTTFVATNSDTINIIPGIRHLKFDIINPSGNGELKYLYKFAVDTSWYELNANELNLPQHLSPDNNYTLSVKAYDNVWRSDELVLHLYIVPYWWQSAVGRRALWVAGIVLLLIIISIAILITRKIVVKANKRKNLWMELELKAVYAQLNPHFIFNTLNSTLLLIRKRETDEAYLHLTRFSRLLRNYMKSSRNKFISVADEIKNLEDYITLQQTRFKRKFTCAITVNKHLNTEKTMLPSLLIQPFVENAINHGLLPKEEMGNLNIRFAMDDDTNELSCIIEDDGIGRLRAAAISNADMKIKNDSYGNLLIKDLMNIFNKYEDMDISIKYTDKELPLTGTIVTINIKSPRYAQPL